MGACGLPRRSKAVEMNVSDLESSISIPSADDATGSGSESPYVLTLDRVVREIPSAQVIITTTLPRGGLQVIHERGADPAWVRAYSREHHLLDATS